MLGLYKCVGVRVLKYYVGVLRGMFSLVVFVNLCSRVWIYLGMLRMCVCENICEPVPALVCVSEIWCYCGSVCKGFLERLCLHEPVNVCSSTFFLPTCVCLCVSGLVLWSMLPSARVAPQSQCLHGSPCVFFTLASWGNSR